MTDPLRPLFEPRGARELFRGGEVFVRPGPLERLPSGLRTGLLQDAETLAARYRGEIEIANGSGTTGHQQPARDLAAGAALALGLSVYFPRLDALVPEIAELCVQVAETLGVPRSSVRLGAFANAPGSGLPLHHDRGDQVLIHLSGPKRLRLGPRSVPDPGLALSSVGRPPIGFGQVYAGGHPGDFSALLAGLEELALEPGTVVHLPGGTWHTTLNPAEPGGPVALSCTLTVAAPSRAEVLLQHLARQLEQDPAWRAPMWGAWGPDPDPGPELAVMAAALGAELGELDTGAACAGWELERSVRSDGPHPLGHRWERFVRLPGARVNTSTADDVLVVVIEGGAARPARARWTVRTGLAAGPIVSWILESTREFRLAELRERFPEVGEADLRELLDHLARGELVRPIPARSSQTPCR